MAVQVALAVVLITGAGLMLRSFSAVQEIDLGFDADRTLYAIVQPPAQDYGIEEAVGYVQRAIEELRAVPGVTAASAIRFIPLNHETSLWQFAPPERAGTPGDEWPTAIANRPYPGYFETMGIPLVAGRDFDGSDRTGSAPVAIVNQALANRHWAGQSPVGRTLLVGDPDDPSEVTVVGVVGGVRHDGLEGDGTRPQIYLPALQSPFRRAFLVARTEGDPAALVSTVRAAVTRLDPNLPVASRPMQSVVVENQLQWSIGTVFLAVFGAGALLLATLGIYGMVSYAVSQRQRELGVRIAMGATRTEIRRVVLGDGLRLTAIGLATGLVAAIALGQLVSATLYGVSPFDPLTLGGVLALFLAVAALASLVPAERASRTDPIEVLRSE